MARSSSCSFCASCTRSSVAESTSAEQPPWVSSRSLFNMSFICRSRCTSSWSWATSSRSRTAICRKGRELYHNVAQISAIVNRCTVLTVNMHLSQNKSVTSAAREGSHACWNWVSYWCISFEQLHDCRNCCV